MPDSAGGSALARPLLFAFWALVFWGTLTLVSLAYRAIEIGLGSTLRLMLFGTPSVSPTLGRFSLVCAVIALATWTTVAWILVRGRQDPRASEQP